MRRAIAGSRVESAGLASIDHASIAFPQRDDTAPTLAGMVGHGRLQGPEVDEFGRQRVADRLGDAIRIDRTKVDQGTQDVRAGDPVSSLRAKVLQIAGRVDHHAVQAIVAAAVDRDQVDGIGVRPCGAPQSDRGSMRGQRSAADREHRGRDALFGRPRGARQAGHERVDLFDRARVDRSIPGRP